MSELSELSVVVARGVAESTQCIFLRGTVTEGRRTTILSAVVGLYILSCVNTVSGGSNSLFVFSATLWTLLSVFTFLLEHVDAEAFFYVILFYKCYFCARWFDAAHTVMQKKIAAAVVQTVIAMIFDANTRPPGWFFALWKNTAAIACRQHSTVPIVFFISFVAHVKKNCLDLLPSCVTRVSHGTVSRKVGPLHLVR